MRITPLDNWIGKKILPSGAGPLTRQKIEAHQLERLRETVSYVRRLSPFYRNLYKETGEVEIRDFSSFVRLPFTTPADVRAHAMKMLCTSQDEIERIVTLQSSGTTGESKRLFFTAEDLELTVDFFEHGMSTMVEPGATVIIFLPGERPDSVGDLLARGLERMGVKAVKFGPVRDIAEARIEILNHESPCLVGIPTQMLALARGVGADVIPKGWVKTVLLSTDYVPAAIQNVLEENWNCRVLTHYGMTETGLGGGVECEAGNGYHLREADLYTEIVDPATGEPVPDGTPGEVVFTTLTRRGMPLLRYRTGDWARILTEPCPCGSVLKRLGRVQGRIEARVPLKDGSSLGMGVLDETLFPVHGVGNFSAELVRREGKDQLLVCLQVCEGEREKVAKEAMAALLKTDPVAKLIKNEALTIGSITFSKEGWISTGTVKRQIKDSRLQAA